MRIRAWSERFHHHTTTCSFALALLTVLLLSSAVTVGSYEGFAVAHAGVYPVPPKLILRVSETAGVARQNEVVIGGVPLPRSLKISNPKTLTLVNAAGVRVPAEFQVLARWNADLDNTVAPIQWLLVTFCATVPASGNAAYRLVTDGSAGSNPPPSVSVRLVRDGNKVTVNTGAGVFSFGNAANALFDSARLAGGTRLIKGSALTARVSDKNWGHATVRRVKVEHAGPLRAVVVVEGVYDMPQVGSGRLASVRRYTFTADSPTAIVRHVVKWEGDLCPENGWDLTCDANHDGKLEVNGLLVTQIRDALTLDLAAPFKVSALGGFSSGMLGNTVKAGQEAWVRQHLRAARTSPLAFDVSVPGVQSVSGQKADGGMLVAGQAAGSVAVALDHMHRYEPQALRLLADGRLAVDVANDKVWLGQRQGLFSTFAVSVLPANPSRTLLNRRVWAPLNHPLHAWPEPAWFASSNAVDEFPVGKLPADLAGYDTLVGKVLSDTLKKVDDKGLAGLMTFGLYPRYWGTSAPEELDCSGNDPTPGQTWDNTYWCATWTDYHNTVATAPIRAMRTGEVKWLDEIGFPGALRTLYTQIVQCGPDDEYFYCGQAPAGYGGYRTDFDSSHQYFDNLFLFYWLTGDQTVVETLSPGGASMREYLCSRRPGEACHPDDPPTDEWARLAGRVASQWYSAFRFLGLAGHDGSFLEDYASGLARAVTQYYVEPKKGSKSYGFWLGDPVAAAGRYSTDQLWMVSLYDMNNLFRLQRDTNDTPLGNPAIHPSEVINSWASTLVDYGSTVSGNGTAQGKWPNQLYFSWSGARIGGLLTSVTANTTDDDPFLYDNGKAALSAVVLRAADQTGDARLLDMGSDLVHLAISAASNENSPLGKIQGIYLSRLHAAVAHLVRTGAGIHAAEADGADTGFGRGVPTITLEGGSEAVKK